MTNDGKGPDARPLSSEQCHQFRERGYLLLDSFLPEAELAELEAQLEPFLRGQVQGMGRDLCDMSAGYDRSFQDFELVNAVLPRRYAPALAGNPFEQRGQEVARALIGEDAVLDYDQLLAKKPHCPAAAFAWHQDLGYWPTGTPDTRTVTISLAFDDADEENGCLGVVPGSQREERLRPHRPIEEAPKGSGLRDGGHGLTIELQPNDEIEWLPVRRGGITLHDERVIHGSAGNRSDRWRRTYVIAFRSRATVEFERSIGFTHSHNDQIQWETHLAAMER